MSGRTLFRSVAVLLATLALPHAGTADECIPALILLSPSYEAPRGFEYAPADNLRQVAGVGGHALGVITASVGWDVSITVRQRCRGNECRLCVNRIEGTAGFGPGRIRVAEHLRGDRCRTEAVLAHEERHSAVFAESTRLGVQRLVDSLTRWAREQAALHVAPEAVDAAVDARHREIEALMKEGTAWIEDRAHDRNERIDGAGEYRKDIEDMNRRCR